MVSESPEETGLSALPSNAFFYKVFPEVPKETEEIVS